jgi:Flp pilus assembly protein TadG
MVEFAAVTVLLVLVLLASVEFGRMVLVSNAVANAARAGVRYAITHGSDRTGSGSTGPSGPSSNPTQVVTVVKNFAAAGALDISKLNISVDYPDAANSARSRVNVTVIYPYDPFTVLPLHINLGTTSQGVIAY